MARRSSSRAEPEAPDLLLVDVDLGVGAATPEDERPSKVVVVVCTDGEDNKSRRYTAEHLRNLTRQQQEQYGWEFVFMGANQDAIQAGQRLGTPASGSLSYASSDVAAAAAWNATAGNLVGLRSGDRRDMSYTVSQRNIQTSFGVAADHNQVPVQP